MRSEVLIMLGETVRELFVQGEVVSCFKRDDGVYEVLVTITNDMYFVCQKLFRVKNLNDLSEQFHAYLRTDEFRDKLKKN